jgi:predicted naringenin-chalcone synthase
VTKIVSISTGVPEFKHDQDKLFLFADKVYSKDAADSRKLKFLYDHSGIRHRYSVIRDYSEPPQNRSFYQPTEDLEPVPTLEERMAMYNKHAAKLSVRTISECIENIIDKKKISHLVTVSCTGMSAPGLDLQIMEMMDLPPHIHRTSVNFMGCYAAIHALKLADAFCRSEKNANVVIVCTELCTLHFQKEISIDNITSSLLFGDGCAALLVQPGSDHSKGVIIEGFFSDVSFKGKQDMAWELSSKGFLMTLSGYVPDLIRENFETLVLQAVAAQGRSMDDISHWCIHPGGKKILDSIAQSLRIDRCALTHSYNVLEDYGNMSSCTILFVLKRIMEELSAKTIDNSPVIFAAAFGPGLTMETFCATYG